MTELLQFKLNKSCQKVLGIMFVFYLQLPHIHAIIKQIKYYLNVLTDLYRDSWAYMCDIYRLTLSIMCMHSILTPREERSARLRGY